MKAKRRLNWVDALILVLVLLLVAGTYMKFRVTGPTSVTTPQSPITYQLLITGTQQGLVDSLRVGDTVYDTDSGNAIGTIADLQVSGSQTLYTADDGTAHLAQTMERYDVLLTINAQGSISEQGYFVNKIYQLNIGAIRPFYTAYVSAQGRVVDIL